MNIYKKYLTDYKKECILAPLFKMLEASFELIVPLVISAIIEVGIKGNNKSYIIKMSLVMVALGLIGLAFSLTAQYFSAKAATGFAAGIRKAMFKHIQALSFNELDRVGTSTLITRMTVDVNQAQNGVNMFLRLFLRSPFVVVGAVAMAYYVNGNAAVVFGTAIPLLAIVVFAIVFFNIPLYGKVQQRLDTVLLRVRENLNGIRVIRAFGREQTEKEAFAQENKELTGMQLKAGRFSALLNPLTYAMINLALVLLLYRGSNLVDTGKLLQGDLIALVNYMGQILVELIKLANLIVLLTKAVACGKRIEECLELPEGMKEAEIKEEKLPLSNGEKAPFLAVRDVGFTYEGGREEALTDIDFTVEKGEIIGVIGGTGSGKSTLVQLLPRLYDVTRGAIYLEGRDIRSMDIDKLRRRFGLVPQKASLFAGTIRENLVFADADASEEAIEEAITVAQAKDFILGKENGLESVVEPGGRNFSGGQKQRLTLARALVRRPEVLILDDSSSALDYATDAALRKALRALSYHPTTFIVSQRTASIAHADRILVLDDGEIVGIGTHDALLQSCKVYKEIYDSQYRSAEA
ncbi:MAG: ABC transporter ATP-binding protein/permease [Lachnospiraceae bacterium]|nr:ABC transporter ATP-binding protein/permease [Lachnospiraceae bacterium]